MTTTQNKLVARSVATSLYFDGTSFSAMIPENALALRTGTTAADFALVWGGGVDVVSADDELAKLRAQNPGYGRKSLAQRIHSGELDKYGAARVHVIERNREGQRSFTIRTAGGKYISRIVKVEGRGPSRSAWIKFQGVELSVVWSRGELALDGAE